MARPKKAGQEEKDNNVIVEETDQETPKVKKTTKNDYGLPQKELFRIDEVANYFGVTEQCIRLWIEHGHLKREKIVGIARIPRDSILECRFRNKVVTK